MTNQKPDDFQKHLSPILSENQEQSNEKDLILEELKENKEQIQENGQDLDNQLSVRSSEAVL